MHEHATDIPVPTANPEPAPEREATIAVFATHVEAETAVRALEQSGFDMTHLSIVGADYRTDEQVLGFYNIGDRIRTWGAAGAFWGGLWGLLLGAPVVTLGLGPLVVAGPLVTTIVGGMEGMLVGSGLSAIGAALASLGIPHNTVLDYETALRAGKYLLIAHGTALEVERARQLLARG